MFDHTHYVPILKVKAGELNALQSANHKGDRFTPLLELLVRTNQTAQAAVAAVRAAWQRPEPVIVDAGYAEQAGDDAAIATFSAECTRADLNMIPVTGTGRSAAQKNATRQAAAEHDAGACLRLLADDTDDPAGIDEVCAEVAAALNLDVTQIDVVLDFAEVGPQFVAVIRRQVCDAIRASNFLQHARSVIVAGSAFPQSMSGIPAQVFTPIARAEWTLWNAIRQAQPAVPRIPTFGDYAASNPVLVEYDPEIMTPAAKIIYTVDLDWLVLKGRSVRGPHGYGQFRQLAAAVAARPEFRTAAFSWGDSCIHECATNATGTGNLTTWVTVKVSHHIAHVVDQIANLPGP